MKVIQLSEAELDRLRDELLTRLERDAIKSQNQGTPLRPVSYDAVHYHVHRLIAAIKEAT